MTDLATFRSGITPDGRRYPVPPDDPEPTLPALRPTRSDDLFDARKQLIVRVDGSTPSGLSGYGEDAFVMHCVGKKAAGRLPDGRTWDEVPWQREAA